MSRKGLREEKLYLHMRAEKRGHPRWACLIVRTTISVRSVISRCECEGEMRLRGRSTVEAQIGIIFRLQLNSKT